MTLRRRLERTSTSLLVRRAQNLIQQVPNEERRKRLEEWLAKIQEISPEERLRRVIIGLILLFVLAGVGMAIGYAITGK